MTVINITVAILRYPFHRSSKNGVEGRLLYYFTRGQFEIQEVSGLAVVSLLTQI